MPRHSARPLGDFQRLKTSIPYLPQLCARERMRFVEGLDLNVLLPLDRGALACASLRDAEHLQYVVVDLLREVLKACRVPDEGLKQHRGCAGIKGWKRLAQRLGRRLLSLLLLLHLLLGAR